ncbi:MAG TPA: IPT/TIG domain-containing protein [Thermoanaerobaculia bacterium]|nr:IPT/TIG domain-containing protein [Thermoanaerobaculia bacterium]
MSRPPFLYRIISVLLVTLLAIDILSIDFAALQAQPRLSKKTNHFGTVITELMAGANGDSSVQFIEMEFGGCGQNEWGPTCALNPPGCTKLASAAMLVFYDAAGNETYRFKFPSDPPCGNNHVLLATEGFKSIPGRPTPNFTIPAVISPISGKVCFKGNDSEASAFPRNHCVSYGSFTGDTETNFGSFAGTTAAGSPAPALPITGTTSLAFTGSDENNASFTLQTASPRNHATSGFTMPTATQIVVGENLFNKETFGGNGRTCASCHVASLSLGLTPANVQSRFATLSTTFDPLFLGETTMNLNTLVVSSPTSTGDQGIRDFEGIITGSGGGTAKVLTKLVAEGSSTIRYLVYGGLSPALSGTISDTSGNSATFVSITAGTLACSAGGSPTATCTNQLEHPQRMRTSNDITNFPQGRSLILENIDGFTNPHSSNHVFRKSPGLDNAKRTAPFGLSGLIGGASTLGEFAAGAVKQHFPRTINRVDGVDFRLPTQAEKDAMDAFQQTSNVPADEDFSLDRFATTAAQIAGRAAFFGSTAKCSKCHSGTVLADTDGSIPGKPGNANFNTGVDALAINFAIDALPTEQSGLREFNTPALFNVKNHAPFFHNGAVATVRQAVEFYSTSAFLNSPGAAEIGGLTFTNLAEIDNIVAFLEGLTERPYTVTAGPLSFGSRNVTAGATATQPVTITNTSSVPITLTTPFVRLAGTDSTQFTISSHDVTGTLGVGASATAHIAFDPSTGGAKTAVLEFLAETPSGVSLTGTGIAAPAITNVSPNSGATTGGRSVTITGTDLTGATVTVDGINAAVTSTSSTTVVFTTPAHAAGVVDVAATTVGGTATATNAYTYVTPVITVTPTSGLTTTETGGTATYTVVLNTAPTSNVSIAISSSDTTEATVSPGVIVFTSANFSVARTVTVTGVNDFTIDGDTGYTIVNAAASSSDSAFNGLNPSDVTGTTTDNGGVAGIVVTPTSGLFTTKTGVTATFTAVLTSPPSANVTFNLTSSDLTEGTVSPPSLTFTPANWFTPQNVTVTGVDDFLNEMPVGYTIVTSAASSADGNYNGRNPADVGLTNYKSIRAQVITDLRTAINAKRALAGLSAAVFTDPSLSGVQQKGIHVTEMRTALDAARTILGESTGGYTDPTLNTGSTKIKAVHIQELKNRL